MSTLARAPSTKGKRHTGRLVLSGFITAAAVAALAGGVTGTASAATDTGGVAANVAVSPAITLTMTTTTFTLTGAPGTTPAAQDVDYTVTTNNLAGYNVTVIATSNLLPAGAPDNTDVIPIADLLVNTTPTATPMTRLDSTPAGTPVQVQTKATRSDVAGDDYTDAYSITIPDVNSDTYSTTLDYVATTL